MKTKKEETGTSGFGETTTFHNWDGLGNSSQNTFFNPWLPPVFIEANEVGETIEFIYKETSSVTYTTGYQIEPSSRVYKIVFSCQKMQWHKSEPIYGRIIPPEDETFEFE